MAHADYRPTLLSWQWKNEQPLQSWLGQTCLAKSEEPLSCGGLAVAALAMSPSRMNGLGMAQHHNGIAADALTNNRYTQGEMQSAGSSRSKRAARSSARVIVTW